MTAAPAPLLSSPLAVPLAFLPPLAQAQVEFQDGGEAVGAAGLLGGGLCMVIALAFAVLSLIAFVWGLVDVIKREDLDGTMKLVWVLVMLFLGVIGTAIYYFAGRGPSTGGKTAPARRDDL